MSKVIFHFSADKTDALGTSAVEQIEVEAYHSLNLLAHAQILERSLQSRCGGQCACGTCRVRILSGKVSAAGADELALLKKVGDHAESGQNLHRLACQCFPEQGDDIHVLVPHERVKDARFVTALGQKKF